MSDITQIGDNITGSASSVSINGSGNIVAIGDILYSSLKGLTKVYKWNGTIWTQLGGDIIGEADGDYSGRSVSLNRQGNILAIGVTQNDPYDSKLGKTKIFQYNSGSWVQLGGDIDGEKAGDKSGTSVSLNSQGNIVAIGAYKNDGRRINSGSTRIYQYDALKTIADANGPIGWNKLGQDIDGEARGDFSGRSVSLNSNGDIVAIGAYLNDGGGNNSGHTRIFQYNIDTWVQLGQDIDGEARGDLSGHSVSLNSQGDIVAIGAFFNDGGGNNSGHTRIFQYNTDTWVQLGQDIDGEDSGDFSGRSVSLNSNGDIVAIGAKNKVRIYEWNGNSWNKFGDDINGEGDFFSGIHNIVVSLNNQGNIVIIAGNGGTYSQVYQLDIDLNLDDLVNSDVSMVPPVVDAISGVTVNKVVTGNTSIASFTAANVTVPSGNPSIMMLRLDAFDFADNQLNLTGLTGNNRIWIEVEYPNYNIFKNYEFLKYDEVTLELVSSPDYPVELKPVDGKPNTLGGYLTGLSVIGLNEKSNTKKKVVPKKKYIYLFNNTTGCKRRVLC